MNEEALVKNLSRIVHEELERAGLEVYGGVKTEVYQRCDRNLAIVTVRAEVGGR